MRIMVYKCILYIVKVNCIFIDRMCFKFKLKIKQI